MTFGQLGRAATLAALMIGAGSAARADGFPPFYGYSPYFGSPAPYFTPESDVRQATRENGGSYGFGTRTYYRGGPFWHWQPTQGRLREEGRYRRWRAYRGRVVLRRRY